MDRGLGQRVLHPFQGAEELGRPFENRCCGASKDDAEDRQIDEVGRHEDALGTQELLQLARLLWRKARVLGIEVAGDVDESVLARIGSVPVKLGVAAQSLLALAGSYLALDQDRVEAFLVERLDAYVRPAAGSVVFERVARMLRGDADAMALLLTDEPGIVYPREAGFGLGFEQVRDHLREKVFQGHAARAKLQQPATESHGRFSLAVA